MSWPAVPSPPLVELLINGTWVDISSFVYQRDPIVVTGGAPDHASKPGPSQMTLTLNNRDGRFTPSNAGGAYYPYLVRNMQIRVSRDVTSSSGNHYAGYRFWGKVPDWPPQADISQKDIYIQIAAKGPLREVRRGGGKGSALTRYYNTLTGAYAPVAYWPCEEDPDASIVGAGIDGGTDMTVTAGTPKWKAVSDFNGSAPIGVLNKSTWDGLTGSVNYSGDDVFITPGAQTWTSPVATATVRCWGPGDKGGAVSGVNGGAGGGGGEFASEAGMALTVGQDYTFIVRAGGSQTAQSFAGDAVTVTAHPGVGAAGGTGSVNTTHHDGGAGGTGSGSGAGGGGGGSGGTAAAGNSGGNASGLIEGAGAGAVTGGGGGGRGAGGVFIGGDTAAAGTAPGGGGGGGGSASGPGSGGAGKVEIIYTPPSVPSVNVIRFILMVPKHGGNGGKVLLRALTGGTIHQLDVLYQKGGKLELKGYNSVGGLLFDSGAQAWAVDGQTVMVSVELVTSGADVAWALRAVKPGASSLLGSATGTQATATTGNVTEVIAGPNGDITKTALGHISVQYGLISLVRVSRALHGHHTEMSMDRFIRLCAEQALGAVPAYGEGSDHWGFEAGTQSWAATNGTVAQSAVTVSGADSPGELDILSGVWKWPSEGSKSLLLTASGAGAPLALSPSGLSGQPVLPGDIVSAALDVYTPAAASNVQAQINWYSSGGGLLSSTTSALYSTSAGHIFTIKVTGAAPTGGVFFAVGFGSTAVLTAGTLIYGDHVRVHARMGPQQRHKLHMFLEEIKDLEQGMMKEARGIWGLGYRTRISLINQTPSVTLDYSLQQLSGELKPVHDDTWLKNDITVHRHKGSKIKVTLNNGAMSVHEPPAGAGRYRKTAKVIAERDEQLLALGAHLLSLGTGPAERYPVISVGLHRSEVAALVSALGGVEMGDYVKIINLASWYPSSTAKQLVTGYTETHTPWTWDIDWNCVDESTWEITAASLRRW